MKSFKTMSKTLAFSLLALYSTHAMAMSNAQEKAYIQQAFANTVENPKATEATYAQYFASNYIQHTDGKTLDYAGFVQHMQALKASTQSIQISFEHIVADHNQVSTVHIVHAVMKDGSTADFKVIAYFQLQNGKFVYCDELTRLISGSKQDANLGSKTSS
jgi:predicted SnoaL-like aldol condensation-catalyzing enzyme